MRFRSAILFTLAPWLLYAAGEAGGHPAIGAASALLAMVLCQGAGWYRMKSTDWTQLVYFALIVLAANWVAMSPILAWRPMLAPGLFAAMAFGSLMIGHPFTNQFAREEAPDVYWRDPAFPCHFARVNLILTFSWGVNFSVALACAWIGSRTTSIHPWVLKTIAASAFVGAM